MSSVAARVLRGCRSLLAPASGATSSSRSVSTATAGATKKSAAKSKAKPKPKPKSDSPAKKTPRSTGIFKVTHVSPALAQFLGTGETTRIDAVKEIWTYVKSHDLQNPADKREIFCDEKLKQIFQGKDKVGFLEITKLLSPHFVKTAWQLWKLLISSFFFLSSSDLLTLSISFNSFRLLKMIPNM